MEVTKHWMDCAADKRPTIITRNGWKYPEECSHDQLVDFVYLSSALGRTP